MCDIPLNAIHTVCLNFKIAGLKFAVLVLWACGEDDDHMLHVNEYCVLVFVNLQAYVMIVSWYSLFTSFM